MFSLSISLLFIKLGIGEFEDWDESHIVYRAQIVERFGAWLDQSRYALGGLYSSSHPPLGVWMMVVSRALFGTSEFATRLPAAICGLIASITIFLLLRHWCKDRIALVLAAAFTASSSFLWYSRHAQLDSLLMASSLASIALFVSGIQQSSRKRISLAGVSFGLSLLSKFGWGIYILSFVFGYAWIAPQRSRGMIIRFVVIGLAIGSTWYVYMALSNAEFLRSVTGWLYGLGAVKDYEPGDKSPIYYFNQLVVACPFIVTGLCSLLQRDSWSKDKLLPLAWLSLLVITLQLAATKFPHFALILLPAAFIIAAQALTSIKRFRWWQWSLIVLAVLWSLSTQFRLYARGASFEILQPRWEIFIPLLFGLSLLIWWRFRRGGIQEALLFALAGLIVITAATRVIGYSDTLFTDGAKAVAKKLDRQESITKLIVVHSGLPFDSITPRLAYYTKGWTSGWAEGKSSLKLGWTDAGLAANLESSATPDAALVLERERDRFAPPITQDLPAYSKVIAMLSERYDSHDSLRSYDLFYNKH